MYTREGEMNNAYCNNSWQLVEKEIIFVYKKHAELFKKMK